MKTEYIFHLASTNKKFDQSIDHALKNTKTYVNKFDHFALTNCSHEVMLKTKLRHTHTCFKIIPLKDPFFSVHHHATPPSTTISCFFSLITHHHIFHISLNSSTNLRNYDPVRQKYIFCPLSNNFPLEDSRSNIISHEYIQPVEIAFLESIQHFRLNHELKSKTLTTIFFATS